MSQLGMNIKYARKKIGLTQEELASQIGVTSQAVSRWESGAGMPDITMLVPIAQVLSVSIDALFGIEQKDEYELDYAQISRAYDQIELNTDSPEQKAIEKCKYMEEKCELAPANHVYACCLVERTADLSRYIDYVDEAREMWEEMKCKAIRFGTQVIRFCKANEWVERTHFALAWIYIHEKKFDEARDHIAKLPSVGSNRLKESIMAQLTSIEYGTQEMKQVFHHNMQKFTRAINKEILYCVEDLSWGDTPENTILFAEWGLNVMRALSVKKEMLPYCRGFFRDIYKYVLNADLRAEDYESGAIHWNELKAGMQEHYDYYQQMISQDEALISFDARQIGHMHSYTKEFMAKKQEDILNILRSWHGEEKVNCLMKKVNTEV